MNQTITVSMFHFLVYSFCLITTGALIPDDQLKKLRIPAALASLGLIAVFVAGFVR